MKAVILAGGLGSRLAEETHVRPKPMVEIGGKPMLWHIMKIYSQHGINEFIICCGYKGYVIKEYFRNYLLHVSDVTIDIAADSIEVHSEKAEPWRVSLIDTGESTQTGGRIKRIASLLDREPSFCLTYGDGLSDVNITALIKHHELSGARVTLTAVQPPGRFGTLSLKNGSVTRFIEKPDEGGWINGGFFVVNTDVLQMIEGDSTVWEEGPLRTLAEQGGLSAFSHSGFWQPMDTIREKLMLEEMWNSGSAPWRTWK